MGYDVIVVGAGSAGSTLAARLSEDADRSVLLLEAGPDYPEFARLPDDIKRGNNFLRSAFGPHNWGYVATVTPQQPDPVPIPRGKVIGGSSAINGQILLRGIPEDYDDWAAWVNEEWVFTKVLPYFRKLETDLDFRGDFHGSDGPIPVRHYRREDMVPYATAFYEACLATGFPDSPDQNNPEATGIGPTPLNNLDGVRISTALAYLDQARHRLNLTIRPNVTARRILFDGKRAVGVEAESGGEIFTVEGEQVVLSAGGIASPQLLLLSGVGPAEHLRSLGIDVVHDLSGVGQNLRDHPMAMILFRETGEMPGDLEAMIQVLLRYTIEGSNTRDDMHIGTTSLDTQYLPANIPTGNENCFAIYVSVQNALSSGELKLTSRDPHVQPFVDYRYLSDSWDVERMRDAVRLGIQLSEHTAFKDIIVGRVSPTDRDLATDAALDSWLLKNVATQFHSSGTCKMGPASDLMTVVDQFCHVHGLEGWRVVDTSVMPNVIRANTNATIIVIAERVADWIKQGK